MSNGYAIDAVRIDRGQMPVSVTFSYGKVDHFPFCIFRLTAGDAVGLGEALIPIGDTSLDIASSLVGRDARALDSLLPQTDNDADRILCEGLSIALHDLVGKRSGLPVHVLLGGTPQRSVPLMPCIFPNDADDGGAAAQRFFSEGYRYLKLKLAGNLAQDLERVGAVRSVAPEGAVLQGDANNGYETMAEARIAVKALGAIGLDILEDPIEGDVPKYQKLSGASGCKIMVDHLARRTDDLMSVLVAKAADVIGIHADQPGSLSRALFHARLAQAFGLPVVIGGTGYTGIGTAAYQHLTAVATPGGPCGELGGAVDHGMPRSLVKTPLPVRNGVLSLPDTPGLGVELDTDALAEFATDHREWKT